MRVYIAQTVFARNANILDARIYVIFLLVMRSQLRTLFIWETLNDNIIICIETVVVMFCFCAIKWWHIEAFEVGIEKFDNCRFEKFNTRFEKFKTRFEKFKTRLSNVINVICNDL